MFASVFTLTAFAGVMIKADFELRAISSVGSEHLPYKQGVTGSSPVSPTKRKSKTSHCLEPVVRCGSASLTDYKKG